MKTTEIYLQVVGEEEILAALVEEINKATIKAKSALEQGLKDAENALS